MRAIGFVGIGIGIGTGIGIGIGLASVCTQTLLNRVHEVQEVQEKPDRQQLTFAGLFLFFLPSLLITQSVQSVQSKIQFSLPPFQDW
jgi:ABC-type antimicrobial peptide transport system permease subunit